MRIAEYAKALALSEVDGGARGSVLDTIPMNQEADLRDPGYRNPTPREPSPTYQRNFRFVAGLLERALRGNKWDTLRLQEAMTASDFNSYFGDVLNRSVMSAYAEVPYTWDSYVQRATMADAMRGAKVFRFDRGAAVLDGPITPTGTTPPYGGTGSTGLEPLSEYPMRYRTSTNYTDQLYKFGARMGFAAELLWGDDLDALKDTPALFGRACRRTEEKRATQMYVSSTGPNATFFSNANLNLVNGTVNAIVTTNNPPLTITSLIWAMIIASTHVDLDGEPISIEDWTLVVPPALKYTAYNIVRSSQVAMNDQGGTALGTTTSAFSAQRLYAPNPISGAVDVVVNYYLPIVNTTSGNTAWYLFAKPSNGRPGLRLTFLRSREAPQFLMKSPNQVLVGEGSIGPGAGSMGSTSLTSPLEGDYETDSIDYKVRHFLGGTPLDPFMAVASTGAGS